MCSRKIEIRGVLSFFRILLCNFTEKIKNLRTKKQFCQRLQFMDFRTLDHVQLKLNTFVHAKECLLSQESTDKRWSITFKFKVQHLCNQNAYQTLFICIKNDFLCTLLFHVCTDLIWKIILIKEINVISYIWFDQIKLNMHN